MSCCNQCCYEGLISNCQDDIKVNGKFTPGANLYWQVKDYHGNSYSIPFVADADGNGTLPMSSLPEGFCNSASYGFEIKVSSDSRGLLPVNIQLTLPYQCIQIGIQQGGEINQIGL